MAEFKGTILDDTGVAISGATVNLYAKGTASPSLANAESDSAGRWEIGASGSGSNGAASVAYTTRGEFDVKITNGSDIVWLLHRDRYQVDMVQGSSTTTARAAGEFTSTTDEASTLVTVFEGDRASMADNDEAYNSYKMSDSAGNQEEVARVTWHQYDINPSADGGFEIEVASAGTLYKVFDAVTATGGGQTLSIGTGLSATAVNIGHSTSEVTIGDNLVVTGNATLNGNVTLGSAADDVITINGTVSGASAVIFEGTASVSETSLDVVNPTADATIKLPAMSAGTYFLPVLDTASTTAISSTPEELNLLDGVSGLVQADFTKLAALDATAAELNLTDGGSTIGTTAVSDGHGIVMNHGGTMAQTTVQTLAAYLDDEITAMPNLVTTAATTVGVLANGSIDTGFGTINNAAAITGTVLTATTNFTMGDTVVTNGVITDSSGLSLAADVTVTGDLTVSGTTTTVTSTTVAIADSLLLLAKDQGTSADAVDFGIYGKYGAGGTAKYAGIFRDQDVTGDPWTFFDGNQAEPGTTVNVGGTGYDLADISAGGITAADGFTGDITGDVTGNADTVTTNANLTGDVTSSGNATTIASAAVDFAHIQNVAANSILGRNANSSGVLSEVALATTQILIGDGTGFTAAALSGDATMTNAGVVTVASATTSAAGKVELATTAEINTSTDAARAMTPDLYAASNYGIRYVQIMAVAAATDLTVADGLAFFHVPAGLDGMDLVEVHAEVFTAPAGSTATFEISLNGASTQMLSTNITIDASETGSDTAATAAVINTSTDDVDTNDLIQINCTQIGSGTAGAGLLVTMGFRIP